MYDKRHNLTISLLSIGIVLVSAVGLTFAYFSANVETASAISNLTSGKVGKVVFDGGAGFTTSTDIQPPWSESKTFTITVAPSTVKQTVYVWLDYINTISDLKCNVKENDGTANSVSLTTTGSSKENVGETTTVKVVEKTFEPSETTQTATFILTMSLPETGVDQISSVNQTFNGTLYGNLGSQDKIIYYNHQNPNGVATPPNAE